MYNSVESLSAVPLLPIFTLWSIWGSLAPLVQSRPRQRVARYAPCGARLLRGCEVTCPVELLMNDRRPAWLIAAAGAGVMAFLAVAGCTRFGGRLDGAFSVLSRTS